MFGLGFTHLIMLGLLALILIGPEELPQVARTLGRLLNELKRGSDSFKDEFRKSARNLEKDFKVEPPNLSSSSQSVQTTHTTDVPSATGTIQVSDQVGPGHDSLAHPHEPLYPPVTHGKDEPTQISLFETPVTVASEFADVENKDKKPHE